MADLVIKRNHNMDPEELRRLLEEKFGPKAKEYGVDVSWEGLSARLSGPLKGELRIEPEEIILQAKLSFTARLFKGKIEREINQALDEILA
ncbi:polyhydroxyalkanoic acid system family protein [Thermodesulfatator atlanticus]|uniref:polyhydroxyalkanoic acid system family protein n=1 Tax=Thermodesulfatator atlanticus TaxID=501497 RepID=UPI000A07AFE3|nr:polyhydroxyalkanoic acid system family protein [Thermodesulfatator atlanticus]